jgi:hypothetical protein
MEKGKQKPLTEKRVREIAREEIKKWMRWEANELKPSSKSMYKANP